MHLKNAEAMAHILKAIAHPARIILLDALKGKDLCVKDLCARLAVDPSVVSRHLAQLKRAGIVSERRDGVKIIHHLACPCILQALECTVGVTQKGADRKSGRISQKGRRS